MSFFNNQTLGVAFLALALALTFLMFYLWRFPYDHSAHRSSAPRSLVRLHRLLGYAYVAVYVVLMWEMVPRLWGYQVELPARTVAHLLLGLSIGAILVVKLAIVRFFKHLEAKLVPFLGTALLICTMLVVGLALPLSLREAYLRDAATSGAVISAERLERVRSQLPKAGFEEQENVDLLAQLTSTDGLLAGRSVLVNKCSQCHDLRTVLVRPRTPREWRQTVSRMANRSTVLSPIDETEQWQVTAYLIAISPTLQQSARMRRAAGSEAAQAQTNLQQALLKIDGMKTDGLAATPLDLVAAKGTFERRCSQCHSPALLAVSPPGSASAAMSLVARMVRNGLRASPEELTQIVGYLTQTYAANGPTAATMPGVGGTEAQTFAGTIPNPDQDEVPNPDQDEVPNPDQDEVPNPDQNKAPLASTRSTNVDTEVDRTLSIRPAGNDLGFEQPTFTVRSGNRIRAVLENTATSGLVHNFLLLRDPAAIDEVTNAALGAPERGFLPVHEAILAGIPATSSGERGSVVFVAPAPGMYPFLCMMPGHSFTMRGTLRVTQ